MLCVIYQASRTKLLPICTRLIKKGLLGFYLSVTHKSIESQKYISMLLYISTNETVEDEDGNEQLPISVLYDYHIVEIREFPNAYTQQVDQIIQPEEPEEFPRGVNYIRPEGDAQDLVYNRLGIKKYDHNPAWVVLENFPDSEIKNFIIFGLDDLESPEKTGEVLRRIYSLLSRDEFDRLN